MSGLDLMQRLNRRGTGRPVILITGHGDVDMAVGAIKNGAFDFIEKPFDEARLLLAYATVLNALDRAKALRLKWMNCRRVLTASRPASAK